jgi:hypothetical protein
MNKIKIFKKESEIKTDEFVSCSKKTTCKI